MKQEITNNCDKRIAHKHKIISEINQQKIVSSSKFIK